MDETTKTEPSGAAMNAKKIETDPAFDHEALDAAGEAWERKAAPNHLRVVHINGPYLMGDKEYPGQVWGFDVSLKRNVVLIIEGDNVVDVHGLPDGWTWSTIDHGIADEGSDEDKREHGFRRLRDTPRSKPRPIPKEERSCTSRVPPGDQPRRLGAAQHRPRCSAAVTQGLAGLRPPMVALPPHHT